MVKNYQGHYRFNEYGIANCDLNLYSNGVYYCGYIESDGKLYPLYIGKGTGDFGVYSRLIAHLREKSWSDVTHFGVCLCDNSKEAEGYESQEINRWKPKYNIQGK